MREETIDETKLKELLEAIRDGAVPVDEALERLRSLPYEDLGFASVDHHRALRKGFPEVVLGEGKSRGAGGGDSGEAGGAAVTVCW